MFCGLTYALILVLTTSFEHRSRALDLALCHISVLEQFCILINDICLFLQARLSEKELVVMRSRSLVSREASEEVVDLLTGLGIGHQVILALS
jgi:hypothetical protein